MKYELNEMMYYLEFILKLVENGINELGFSSGLLDLIEVKCGM